MRTGPRGGREAQVDVDGEGNNRGGPVDNQERNRRRGPTGEEAPAAAAPTDEGRAPGRARRAGGGGKNGERSHEAALDTRLHTGLENSAKKSRGPAAAAAARGELEASPVTGEVTAAAAAAAVERYRASLRASQAELLASVGGGASIAAEAGGAAGSPRLLRHFTVAANGFAAVGLSEAQAAQLRARPDVASVTPIQQAVPATFSVNDFMGTAGPAGVWQAAFGGAAGAAGDVLVGVLDSGVNVGAASFAGPAPRSPNLWPGLGPGTGACGEPGTCNQGKLLACRFFDDYASYVTSVDSNWAIENWDKSTCVDTNGHGSHVMATAAGDLSATARAGSRVLSQGGMSGVAPGAAVAAYKISWMFYGRYDGQKMYGQAWDSDVISAMEQAILDGVDVINFSFAFPVPDFVYDDPMAVAWKNAAAAGVVVSAAAGNDGPAAAGAASGPVTNGAPWIITVAAGSHDRRIVSVVAIAGTPGAANFSGASDPSRTADAGPAPLYFAGADAANSAGLCLPGSLDPGAVTGKIVLCLRGVINRVDKAAEVQRAGGVGIVLANTNTSADDDLYPDPFVIPGIHVKAADGASIIAAIVAAPSTVQATLKPAAFTFGAEAPFVMGFSSRGPLKSDGGHLLKPDILAPGGDVFGPVAARDLANGTTGQFLSGTSMAAPMVTGLAALIRSKHPSWSPAAIKSAIMTSASQVTNKGRNISGTPFDYGAGHIDPSKALDPGLVYDMGLLDYDVYSCTVSTQGSSSPANCSTACAQASCAYPQGLRDANLPSFSLPGLRASAAVTASRRVTFVGAAPAPGKVVAFRPRLALPPGFKAVLTVAKAPGFKEQKSTKQLQFGPAMGTRSFTLKITPGAASPKGWSFGSLVWVATAGGYAVRSPIALQVVG